MSPKRLGRDSAARKPIAKLSRQGRVAAIPALVAGLPDKRGQYPLPLPLPAHDARVARHTEPEPACPRHPLISLRLSPSCPMCANPRLSWWHQ
jgi:hypothetical protein